MKCTVIGSPIAQSLSPVIHEAAYHKLGLSDYSFDHTEVSADSLPQFIASINNSGYRGVSVTIPHKVKVMCLLDKLDSLATNIGAVNTIVNDDGVLTGYNTDYLGVVRPLEGIVPLKGSAVLVLGAGGAARAAVFGLVGAGAKVFIYNRNKEKALGLAKDSGSQALEMLGDLTSFDVIVNMTSVGMTPNMADSPIEGRMLNSNQIVFDAVYNPLETKLIRDAKAIGCSVVYGTEMFLYQAAEQFLLYTGLSAPIEEMRKVLMEALRDE